MLIKKPADIKSAEITPREIYLNRRQFITSASAAVVTTGAALAGLDILRPSARAYAGEKLANVKKSSYSIDEKQNSFKDITSYNNFYELGVDKGDPAENAKYLTTRPWTVAVEGEVKKPKTFDIDSPDETELRSKSGSIGCVASKPGRWSFPGSAFHSAR